MLGFSACDRDEQAGDKKLNGNRQQNANPSVASSQFENAQAGQHQAADDKTTNERKTTDRRFGIARG